MQLPNYRSPAQQFADSNQTPQQKLANSQMEAQRSTGIAGFFANNESPNQSNSKPIGFTPSNVPDHTGDSMKFNDAVLRFKLFKQQVEDLNRPPMAKQTIAELLEKLPLFGESK